MIFESGISVQLENWVEAKQGVKLYWPWELDFLLDIQASQPAWLTWIMKILSLLGSAGALWIVISIICAIIPKSRKCGFTMIFAMVITFIIGNLILKNVLARFRPCWVYDLSQIGNEMHIKIPTDYSFPSGHTMNGVTASLVILFYTIKSKRTVWMGAVAVVLAGLIAFSRMYLFVHWPTDIIVGALVGIIDAIIAYFVMKKVFELVDKARAKKNAAN